MMRATKAVLFVALLALVASPGETTPRLDGRPAMQPSYVAHTTQDLRMRYQYQMMHRACQPKPPGAYKGAC